MYSQKDKDRFKELNGISIDDFIAGHNDAAEKPLTLPEGQLLTDAQLTARDEVKVKEGKTAGEAAAKTALIKEVASKTGLTLAGDRMGDLVTGIKEGLSKDKDAAFKALQDQNAALLADNTKYQTEATQAKTQLETGMFEISILSKLPAHVAGLTPKESFELAKMRGYAPEKTDTGIVWKKNGEVLKDPTTHAPLAEDKAIASIWESEKWTPAASAPPAGGRGAQQRASAPALGSIKTKTEAEAAWAEQNPDKNINTPEGMAFYNDIVSKTPDFNMFA